MFDTVSVKFDRKEFDVIVNDKEKKSYGKGYRAIINSAFLISLMNYVVDINLPHPKLIVLDSPLTTYKGKNKDDDENNNIDDEVKKLFYKNLSENLKGKQVIIFDNVEPSVELLDRITYYHFSKSKKTGLYGLFPIWWLLIMLIIAEIYH